MFSLHIKVKLSPTPQPNCNVVVNRSVMLHAKLYRPVIVSNYSPNGRWIVVDIYTETRPYNVTKNPLHWCSYFAHWFIKGLHGRHKPVPFIRWLQVNPHRVRWITIYAHRLSACGKCKSFKVIKQVRLSKHPSVMSLTLWNEDKKYIQFVWSCTSWPPFPDLNWCSLLRGRIKSGRTSFIKELIAFAKLKIIR